MRTLCFFFATAGPVYSAPPSKHDQMKKEAFKPEERELIFDIDMTGEGVVNCGVRSFRRYFDGVGSCGVSSSCAFRVMTTAAETPLYLSVNNSD